MVATSSRIGEPQVGAVGVGYVAGDSRTDILTHLVCGRASERRVDIGADDACRYVVAAIGPGQELVHLREPQRLHAAQHYRQTTTFLLDRGAAVPELDLGSMYDLRLPQTIY